MRPREVKLLPRPEAALMREKAGKRNLTLGLKQGTLYSEIDYVSVFDAGPIHPQRQRRYILTVEA